ncbi:MAG: hypothetical protein NTY22_02780, partial [Proteobacteria bacterium]|nr:hypothetical protein [Pseudomonadota bacterium]
MKKLFLIFCTMFLFSLGVYGFGGPSPIAVAKNTGVLIDYTGNDQYWNNRQLDDRQDFYPIISFSTEDSYYLT